MSRKTVGVAQELPQLEQSLEKVRQEYLSATYGYMEEPKVEVSMRDVEKSFLSCIALGNPDLLQRQLEALRQHRIVLTVGKMGSTPLRQERYGAVASIALACRTAIDNGLPEHLAYSISDTFIQNIDSTEDLEKIAFLHINALLEYCQVMQDWRLREYCPPVRSCCEYILLHLHEAIRLSDLSRVGNLSPNYLSSLFVRDTGMRPNIYIRAQKLNYARYILDLYDTPITTLSDLLAFPSPSAFAQQFKRLYGVTPAQYQQRRMCGDAH